MVVEEVQLELYKIVRSLRRTLIDIEELQAIIKDANFASGRMRLIEAIEQLRKTHLIEP